MVAQRSEVQGELHPPAGCPEGGREPLRPGGEEQDLFRITLVLSFYGPFHE